MTKRQQRRGRVYLTTAQMALLLGVTPRTVRREIEGGALKATRGATNGQAWYRIPLEEADRYLRVVQGCHFDPVALVQMAEPYLDLRRAS